MKLAGKLLILIGLLSACSEGYIDCEIAIKNLRDEIVKINVKDGKSYEMPSKGYSYDDYVFYTDSEVSTTTVTMSTQDSDGEFTNVINTVEVPVQDGGLYYLDTETPTAINLSSLGGDLPGEDEEEGENSQAKKDCEDDPTAKKYQDMINEGIGCQPCANCAILACMLYLGVEDEKLDLQIEAVKLDEEFYGAATCPELY